MEKDIKQHTISVLVENKFGALARIAGLFSGRGYNIESLTVNHTHDPNLSRMTIVTRGDDDVLEQIEKQLNKLVDVVSVTDLDSEDYLELEKEGAPFEELEKLTLGGLRRAVVDGDVKTGSVMSGQIAGMVKDEKSCKEIIEQMMNEMEELLKGAPARL